jgi:hypothetical protein
MVELRDVWSRREQAVLEAVHNGRVILKLFTHKWDVVAG